MLFHLVVSAALAAGKGDASLAGSWVMGGEPFMTLNANGTGVMDGEKMTWSTQGSTLVVRDAEGGEDRVTYALSGDSLMITVNGIPMQLTRAGKSDASKPKGVLSRKVEAHGDAVATPAVAPAPTKAGSDQLSQLLLSSNWCYLRYASGNTYTQKVHFSPDGTWSDLSESDIHVNNSIGIAEATNDRSSNGQWAVRNGQLLMSKPPETPQLTPLPLTVNRNSNGYPILNAAGKEYSMCR